MSDTIATANAPEAHPLAHIPRASSQPKRGKNMQITVFGATGKVGGLLIDQALKAGHAVTAVVRDPARLTALSKGTPRVVTADVMDPQAITEAVAGADAVISALGPPGRGPTSILTDSTPSIITAMNKAGATRLITISGSMVDDTGDGPLRRCADSPPDQAALAAPTDCIAASRIRAVLLSGSSFLNP